MATVADPIVAPDLSLADGSPAKKKGRSNVPATPRKGNSAKPALIATVATPARGLRRLQSSCDLPTAAAASGSAAPSACARAVSADGACLGPARATMIIERKSTVRRTEDQEAAKRISKNLGSLPDSILHQKLVNGQSLFTMVKDKIGSLRDAEDGRCGLRLPKSYWSGLRTLFLQDEIAQVQELKILNMAEEVDEIMVSSLKQALGAQKQTAALHRFFDGYVADSMESQKNRIMLLRGLSMLSYNTRPGLNVCAAGVRFVGEKMVGRDSETRTMATWGDRVLTKLFLQMKSFCNSRSFVSNFLSSLQHYASWCVPIHDLLRFLDMAALEMVDEQMEVLQKLVASSELGKATYGALWNQQTLLRAERIIDGLINDLNNAHISMATFRDLCTAAVQLIGDHIKSQTQTYVTQVRYGCIKFPMQVASIQEALTWKFNSFVRFSAGVLGLVVLLPQEAQWATAPKHECTWQLLPAGSIDATMLGSMKASRETFAKLLDRHAESGILEVAGLQRMNLVSLDKQWKVDDACLQIACSSEAADYRLKEAVIEALVKNDISVALETKLKEIKIFHGNASTPAKSVVEQLKKVCKEIRIGSIPTGIDGIDEEADKHHKSSAMRLRAEAMNQLNHKYVYEEGTTRWTGRLAAQNEFTVIHNRWKCCSTEIALTDLNKLSTWQHLLTPNERREFHAMQKNVIQQAVDHVDHAGAPAPAQAFLTPIAVRRPENAQAETEAKRARIANELDNAIEQSLLGLDG